MGVINSLCMEKKGRDGKGYFQPLTMLNTQLKILAKLLDSILQAGSEQTSAVKGRIILINHHRVRLIIE